ncbi:MAG: HipA domain-containing protein [Verrucomicrobia bacterium]|nr:HipA domain-containing protein [Verrucomicrobiota bacterium]MDA1088527.1 HipA domain-containing protein [Verrucomicrobiota bacterium]
MPERQLTVFIYLPGHTTAVPAGIFTHDSDAGIGRFDYGRRYLERPNALPVDPVALPLGLVQREITVNEGLYGAFCDAAPDYWGRLVIAAECRTAPEALSECDFLLSGNATRVGNLDFRESPSHPEPVLGPPHFNQLRDIALAAEHLEAGDTSDARLLRLLRQGTSIGGARPKCTVELDGALWIAKFPAKDDTINIPRIEYATMQLAQRCGICTPQLRLVQAGGKDIYLTRRFDRERHGSGWLRHGFLSSLSLMEWDVRDRLLWEYPGMASRMRRHMSAGHLVELFRRMVFNVMVRNTDDHPRNHGFLVRGGEIELSPAYDIVPALTQAGVGTEYRLAMSVGDEGREATLPNVLSRSAQFGLLESEATQIIGGMRATCREWPACFREAGMSERDIDIVAPSIISAR